MAGSDRRWDAYLRGVLQDGEQTLLDSPDQLQSSVKVFWFQQADARGQVGALQQRLLCQHQPVPGVSADSVSSDVNADGVNKDGTDVRSGRSLTQQDLQSVGVQVQSLRLLLHHIHLLRLLVVVAVDTGVGQHLQTLVRAWSAHSSAVRSPAHFRTRRIPFWPEPGLYKHR